MKKILLLFCLSIAVSMNADVASAWAYGTAASHAQQGNWADAQKQLNQLLVNAPDKADILYDSGVTAYRLGEFEKAVAYFNQVPSVPDVDNNLKKQAHFNLGNTKVALNQLSDAIAHYEQVLALEPDNEFALHNLEKVKEMLRQQQENQQQKNKQQKNNNKQDQQDQHNQQDEQQDAQHNDNQQSQQNSSGSDQKNDTANNQGSSGDQESANNGDPRQSQKQSTGSDQKEKNEADNEQKGDKQHDANHKPDQQHRNNQQNKLNNSHMSASNQQKEQQQKQPSMNASHTTKNEHKEQAMQTGVASDMRQDDMRNLEPQLATHERWMARVLAHQEKADQKAQKILIKSNINKQLAGQDGQNCW